MKKTVLIIMFSTMGSLLHVNRAVADQDSQKVESLQDFASKCKTKKCDALHRVLQAAPRVQTDLVLKKRWELDYIACYGLVEPAEHRPSFDMFFEQETGMKNNSQNRLKVLHEKLDRHQLSVDDKKIFFRDELCASDDGIGLADDKKLTQSYQQLIDALSLTGVTFYEISTQDPAEQAGCLIMNYMIVFDLLKSQLKKEVGEKRFNQ